MLSQYRVVNLNQVSSKAYSAQSTNSQMKLLMAGFFILSCLIAKPSLASATDEKQCFDYVQDKINWNYDHNSRWEDENIKQLCKGTTQYKEPGECFHRVMHGGTFGNKGIDYGSGTAWNWKNAVALCSGTDSASERVNCFTSRVDSGEKWNAAIPQCLSVVKK